MVFSASDQGSKLKTSVGVRFEIVAASAIFILVPVFGFWPIVDGHRSFFINYDNVQQFYPWYQKLAQAVHHGYLPIWDANVLSGHSFVGEFQPGTFYPLNILFVAAFGSAGGIDVRALEWLVLLHYFIACAGMYFVCRVTGISVLSSTAAATLFAYGGTFSLRASAQTCIFFGDALIPIALLCALLCIKRNQLAFAACAGIIVGLAILAGHLQPPSIAMLFIFGIFAGEGLRRRRLAFAVMSLLITAAVALFVALPQLFFGLQYLSHAYRWVNADAPILGTTALPFATYLSTAYSPAQFLNAFDPWDHPVIDTNILFIGCIPLIVAFLALCDPRSRQSAFRMFAPVAAIAVVGVFSLIMMSGPMTPIAHIVFSIPFSAAALRELGRYAIAFQIFAVIAVGVAIDALAASGYEHLKQFRPITIVAILICFGYAVFVRSHCVDGVFLSNLLVATLLAILIFKGPNRRSIVAALVAVEVAYTLPAVANDSSSPTYPAAFFSPDPLLRPAERCYPSCRISSVGDAYPANIGDVFPVQTTLGHGATMYEPYYNLLGDGGFDPHGFVQDALNVRYVVSDQKLDGFKLVQSDPSTGRYLYERENAFPRVYSYRALTSKDIHMNDVSFKVVSYSDLESEYDVHAPKAETVVFAEQFYPGWSVSVDGARAQMLEASVNGSAPILRAVDVASGDHRIRFEYPR